MYFCETKFTAMTITDLEPKAVWRYFSEICSVPRGSGNEAGIRNHIINFAKEHGFEYKVDDAGNLIMRKDGTGKSIVLQGHMDMVCEKNSDTIHDFRKDPIEVIIDGDTVKAKGTTLGGDDGIGLAIAMALFTDTDVTCPLEALFTVEEETGLTGAIGLRPNMLHSDTMINLDSEDDEEIIIGCAGGIDTSLWLEIEREKPDFTPFGIHLKFSGFTGGHSGEDIDKPRANANKLLAEFLKDLKTDYRIVKIKGGGLRNAIPREAEATIVVPWQDKESVRVAWNIYESELEAEWKSNEPDFYMTLDSVKVTENAYTKELNQKIVGLLCDVPHGVIEFRKDDPTQVNVSTNLAFIRDEYGKILIGTSQRSANIGKRDVIACKIADIGVTYGATATHSSGYPGWEPKENSALLSAAVRTYKELFGSDPKVKTIHAGLECGLFSKSYPDMDMISIGPKILGIHSPAETLYVDTVKKCWLFTKTLCQALQ